MTRLSEVSVNASADTNQSAKCKLLGMSWVHFLNDGSANYLPGILPAVLIAMHEPVRMAGVIMAILLIGQALQPLFGYIADRLGGNILIWLGLLCSTIGGGLVGLPHTLGPIIGLLLLIGAGNAAFHPQALAVIRGMSFSRPGLQLSMFMIGGECGRGLWPTVASWVVAHLGLTWLWILAIPSLLTLPFAGIWAPSLKKQQAASNKIKWKNHLVPMLRLLGFSGTRSLITYGMVTFIPIIWNLRGGGLVSGASIISTLITVGIVGNLSGGFLVDKLGKRPVIVFSSLSALLFVPCTFLARGFWIWLAAAVLGMSIFASSSVTILVGQDIFAENRSMGSGIALGLSNGIGAFLVFLLGMTMTSRTINHVIWELTFVALVSFLFSFIVPMSRE